MVKQITATFAMATEDDPWTEDDIEAVINGDMDIVAVHDE